MTAIERACARAITAFDRERVPAIDCDMVAGRVAAEFGADVLPIATVSACAARVLAKMFGSHPDAGKSKLQAATQARRIREITAPASNATPQKRLAALAELDQLWTAAGCPVESNGTPIETADAAAGRSRIYSQMSSLELQKYAQGMHDAGLAALAEADAPIRETEALRAAGAFDSNGNPRPR